MNVDANLFRIAHMTASTEAVRYYLNGVFVTPHKDEGVLLVSTDGHRLTVVHDKSGVSARSAIVKMPKDILKLCKTGRDGKEPRLLVEGGSATLLQDGNLLRAYPDAEIDDTFPDFRRVVPAGGKEGSAEPTWFKGHFLADYGVIGTELLGTREKASMSVHFSDPKSPALIKWLGVDHAFGVLMPAVFGKVTLPTPDLPEWWSL